MNGIEKEQYNMLMVLLENGIIEETHYISEREHVNTTEDVASELLNEYAMLVNGVDASQDQALNLAGVMPRSLTAKNGAKSLLNGEFFETVEIPNEEYCGCGECDYCHDFPETEETITIKVPVTWTTIKEIYAKIVAHYVA